MTLQHLRHMCPRGWHAAAAAGLMLLSLASPAGAGEPSPPADARADTPPGTSLAPPALQRQAFLAAERALRNGDRALFEHLSASLRDYPLYPYLVFESAERHLAHTDPGRVRAFLRRYANTPLAPRLRADWLEVLARQRRWGAFLADYRPDVDEDLQCRYARALLSTHHAVQADVVIRALWLTGRSRPASCDAVFAAWRGAGNLTPALVWERIHLAMQAGQSRLAGYLARYLPPAQRPNVALWRRIRRHPADILSEAGLLLAPRYGATLDAPSSHETPVASWILGDGLRRLARQDPEKAAAFWQSHGTEAPVTADERAAIRRSIALALADAGDAAASRWLPRIQDPRTLQRLRTTHILAALRDGDWEQALTWIDALVPDERNTDRWRYWRARSLAAMGDGARAKTLYAALAAQRSYYGFLAADRIGATYRFEERPLVYRAADLREVADLPGIQRARELFYLGRMGEARAEWHAVLQRLTETQLLKAAQLAAHWGWHDRAILTLGRAQYWDDLKLRFPLAYQHEVVSAATRHDVDPAWAFAVIRQESAFTPDARSPAGALGLMQLLPRTARQMAHALQLHLHNRLALLDADMNIRLGVRYLKRVDDRFDGHTVLATAAYNAGAQRVRAWQPRREPMAADIWIDTLPYAETRQYLRRVLTYTVIYQQRLGQPPVPLQRQMSVIPAREPSADDSGTQL